MRNSITLSGKLVFLYFALFGSNQSFSQSISLEQAMADPDWMGRAPQQAYWSDDSGVVYFRQKRQGTEQTDLYRVNPDGTMLEQIQPSRLAEVDVQGGDYSPDNRFKTYAREGDIYVKDLGRGDIRQLTRNTAAESNPVFSSDNSKVIFNRDNAIFVRDLATGLEYQAADLRMEDAPADEEKDEFLEAQQLRLFEIIQLQEAREKQAEQFELENQQQDPARIDLPYYLGEDMELVTSVLSPNENWLVATVRNSKQRDPGRAGTMPNYVTATGYVENREVRTRVGTSDFADQQIFLFDLNAHQYAELDLSNLPDRVNNPLANLFSLNAANPETTENDEKDSELRDIAFTGLLWSDDGNQLLFQAISRDNKDRWLLTLNTAQLSFSIPDEESSDENNQSLMAPLDLAIDNLSLVHHNSDPAWINRSFISAQWLPDNESLYFLSEENGYGHLYLFANGEIHGLTVGNFEVREPTASKDGGEIYFRGNVNHPTIYEIFRVDIDSKELQQITRLGGMNNFRLSPDESMLLISHSDALNPAELYVQNNRPDARATKITETISEEFSAINWAQPEFVAVPSSYSNASIHSRVYTPQQDSQAPRAAVVFIHGAGYLQNAHQGWSSYFREFMFHSFLVQQNYVVLDMDYRASSGYGRDWRTTIYQQMGIPEVQDLTDGVDWLVENRNVDRSRVCTYGGSYGGFLTLMALFTAPELFACGAALRPVTDWASYNHGYTSNILNIPELDPAAYERSSPIEFAEGLQKPLLIAHGMQDNNVFFQDSVRLVQRLIELKKENWEMAMYPIEAHGFREPSSWLDEYRRIFKLFEENLSN